MKMVMHNVWKLSGFRISTLSRSKLFTSCNQVTLSSELWESTHFISLHTPPIHETSRVILSSIMIFYLAICVILLTCIWFLLKANSPVKSKHVLPNGPRGHPFVGHVFQILKDPHIKFHGWAQEFGDLFTVYFASIPVLVVNDPQLMKEVFSTFPSTGKFFTDTTLLWSFGPYGILNTEGKPWAEERQFCLRGLKNFGFGRGSLEPLILEEAQELCKWIQKEMDNKGIVVLNNMLKGSTNNALWTIIAGERLNHQDSRVAHLMEKWVASFQTTIRTGLSFLPVLKYIAPDWSGYNAYHKACFDIHEYVKAKFQEHKTSYVKGEHKDVLDLYIERENSARDEKERELIWKNNVATIANLFIAGGETSASTLNFLVFYMAQHPDVQTKLHKEIDGVIGRSRDPSMADKSSMPYLEAVILETLRYSTLAPMGVPHQLSEDVKLGHYHLPKGMVLMPNIYHSHRKNEVWGDPDNFRPERFLGSDVEELKKYLVPFGVGKRQCAGESLAKDVIFLFSTKLFQEFTVSGDPKVELSEYSEPDVGALLVPKPFGVVLKPRK